VENLEGNFVLAEDMVPHIPILHGFQWKVWEAPENQSDVYQCCVFNNQWKCKIEMKGPATYGGAAKGMPKNCAVVPTTCPRKDPYGSVTTGLELVSRDSATTTWRDKKVANKENPSPPVRSIFGSLCTHSLTTRIYTIYHHIVLTRIKVTSSQ